MFARIRITSGIFAILTCMVVGNVSAQTTWYVATNGSDSTNTGKNGWDDAFLTISNAVAKSASLDTILVGAGEYVLTATIDIPSAKDIHLLGVAGPSNTVINGNYPACEIRGINAANGRIGGFTITNAYYHPVSGADGGGVYLDTSAMMTNCILEGNYAGRYGGGALVYGGVLSNCIARDNRAGYGGGVMARAAGQVLNCWIENNVCTSYGGGIYLMEGSLASNCVFVGNTSGTNGGGCAAYGSSNLVTDCVISGNVAGSYGGGISLMRGSLASNCVFVGNTSGTNGGGCAMTGSSNLVADCIISGNVAGTSGGGIHVSGNSVLRNSIICCNKAEANQNYAGGGVYMVLSDSLMLNCLVYGNEAPNGGGGGVCMTHDADIDACTIVSNSAGITGGGIYTHWAASGDARLFIRNSIVYSNTAPDGPNWSGLNTQYTWFTNSCITNPTMPQGSGNITAYPEFIDPVANNYRLADGSPCINAGLNQDWMTDDVDLDGHQRLDRFTRQVDMGCYEHVWRGTMFNLK